VVFINHANHLAIVGDVLFEGSVGRTDFPYGDGKALIAAIVEKLLPLPDDYQFVCGHGPGSTIGAERASNPYLRG
jgi:hydroxyacylglutathione hydrolase